MKLKTIDAVNAYKEIKDLKVNSLGDEAALAVWRNSKSLRPVAEEYNRSVEEVNKSLQDKEYISMTERAQAYNTQLAKYKEDNKAVTQDMLSEVKAINDFFAGRNKTAEKYFRELNDKEVEISIELIDENEIIKAIKASEKSYSNMLALSFLIK